MNPDKWKHPAPWYWSGQGDWTTLEDANGNIILEVPWDDKAMNEGGINDTLNELCRQVNELAKPQL